MVLPVIRRAVHNFIAMRDRDIAAAHDRRVRDSERAIGGHDAGSVTRELAEATADPRFPSGFVRTIQRMPSCAARAEQARQRLADSRAAAARAAAVGSLPGRPAVGTHHATVPRPPDEPREGGRGAAISALRVV
jgi:hypothetical protein